MLGIGFKKAPPTVYVIHHSNGRVVREGSGLNFWYFAPTSTVIDIPVSSRDVHFAFFESTADFQQVTLQGQVTYRITDPIRLSHLVDFSVRTNGKYLNERNPEELLGERLVNAAQVIAKAIIQRMDLRTALSSVELIVPTMLEELKAAEAVQMLGLEILDLSLLQIKPTPEMSRALEAEAREALQRQADEAIYSRRNAAVEQERRIKESELNTEIAVETKQRQIRETKIAADIAIEEQRATLIDRKVENERKDADSKAYALETSLRPVRDVDWKTLMAVAAKEGDSRLAIAMAFNQLAENAGRIGQLNVTPDLLETLLDKR
jgi:regulator of protease activity HflC (stomatin/prohibitin superfamily)